jgi:hypothetical protein
MFEKCRYDDLCYGEADTSFIYRLADYDFEGLKCAIMDDMNLIAERKIDDNSHTWKYDSEKMKLKVTHILNNIEDLMV